MDQPFAQCIEVVQRPNHHRFLVPRHVDGFRAIGGGEHDCLALQGGIHVAEGGIAQVEAFDNLAKNNTFLEHAHVHNNRYGVSREAWKRAVEQQKIPIFEIDIQGAQSIRKVAKELQIEPKYVFVSPKSMSMLRDRLVLRGTETNQEIDLRINNARKELEAVRMHPELFDYILINDDFSKACNNFFRLTRDEYKWLPSPAKMQMLVRRSNKVKKLQEELKTLEETRDSGSGVGSCHAL